MRGNLPPSASDLPYLRYGHNTTLSQQQCPYAFITHTCNTLSCSPVGSLFSSSASHTGHGMKDPNISREAWYKQLHPPVGRVSGTGDMFTCGTDGLIRLLQLDAPHLIHPT